MVPICGQRENEWEGWSPAPHPPFLPWAQYPQGLSDQVGQGSTVRAQLSKGLHLAHLHQHPVETDSRAQTPAGPGTHTPEPTLQAGQGGH